MIKTNDVIRRGVQSDIADPVRFLIFWVSDGVSNTTSPPPPQMIPSSDVIISDNIRIGTSFVEESIAREESWSIINLNFKLLRAIISMGTPELLH